MMPRSLARLIAVSFAGELLLTLVAWRHNRAAALAAVALRWAPGLIAAQQIFREGR